MFKLPNLNPFWRALPLFLVMLLSACGGASSLGIDRFSGGKTITLDAFADIEIATRVVERVAAVRAIPAGLTIPRGGVAVFSATADDSAGRFLANVRFEWRMRHPQAGRMSPSGVFTASNVPGIYRDAIEIIAIQTAGDREFTAVGSASVIVTTGFLDSNIASVLVFPSTVTARVGELVPLRAAALGENRGLVQDLDLFWRVLDDSLGEIDQNGTLTIGNEPGFYADAVEVQARRLSGSGAPVVGRASITVLTQEEASQEVRAIIGPSTVFARPQDRIPLMMLAFDFNGRPVEIDRITWETLEDGVGTVDARGRLVIGDEPGQYPRSIRATATLGGAYAGRTVTVLLDVVVQPPLGLELVGVPGQAQIIPGTVRLVKGQSARVSALYFAANGRAVSEDRVPWEADASVVTIDERGRMIAVGEPGVYPDAVRATLPDIDGTTQVVTADVVILGPLARVQIIPLRTTLGPGELQQYLAEAFDEANNRLFDVTLRWALVEGTPGTMTTAGLYAAGSDAGLYEGGVHVRATQRQPR